MPVRSDVDSILTVNTPASTQEGYAQPYDLTTLTDAKAELSITNTNYDARLAKWITQSSLRIMSYTRRVFAIESVTELFRFPLWRRPSPFMPATDELVLKRWPINTLETLSVVEDANSPLTINVDFEVDPDGAILWRLDQLGQRIHWNTQTVTVEYQNGFSTGDVRWNDLELACLILLKQRFNEQGTRDPNLRQETIVGVVERQWWVPGEKQSAMPLEVQDLLQPYCGVLV